MTNETYFKEILDVAKENPQVTAVIGGAVGIFSLFALWKCRNCRVAYGGMELAQQDPRSTSRVEKVAAKENATAFSTGSNPLSSVRDTKTEGSATSFSVDSETSEETLKGAKGLLEVATRRTAAGKKKR